LDFTIECATLAPVKG